MLAKVCDLCYTIIARGNDEILNGDKVLIYITTETETREQQFEICQECFYRLFGGESIQIKVDRQILADSEKKS